MNKPIAYVDAQGNIVCLKCYERDGDKDKRFPCRAGSTTVQPCTRYNHDIRID